MIDGLRLTRVLDVRDQVTVRAEQAEEFVEQIDAGRRVAFADQREENDVERRCRSMSCTNNNAVKGSAGEGCLQSKSICTFSKAMFACLALVCSVS